ncbi:hypothetical protein [Novacetimonas hansenii]|uniref:Uncharacterized protein n=1 Tax=Novacetimonas hansenii TaxID=436 RepID=A0ABQ0SGU9_NOVHA|nr:hypothetical protein [Novacetimonas hansenii]GAN84024.1 hypothetical protein Gaha_0122_024 [Novacetimonas hansenii JCM 7643]GBQ55793.1 hypothetical protein AA0243_1012 [Novacetimonas hansenii NRIC 0243]GEC64604.1 hypothetical protein GHA01_24530 [Novacetimonas hansenii]
MSDDDAFAIKPTGRDVDLEKIDRVAEGHGFIRREVKTRRNHVGLTLPINVKLDQETYNAFMRFCSDHDDMTYRKAIGKLLKMAGYLKE